MYPTYLSDSLARLARNKGFDWACDHFYYDDAYGALQSLTGHSQFKTHAAYNYVTRLKNSDLVADMTGLRHFTDIESMTTTPDDLQKWLRQERDVHFVVVRRHPARILQMAPLAYYVHAGVGFPEDMHVLSGQAVEGYSTYEKAQEVALTLLLLTLPDVNFETTNTLVTATHGH
jgi:hypothetical protein